jgi:ribosome-associated heat shock protein Hsp15
LVKFQNKAVKASKQVLVGEVYAIKTEARKWIIQVTKVIETRVAYSVAITCYVDLTPEEDKIATTSSESQVFYTGKRQSKQGRPTKKKRRELGQFGEEE